MLLVSNTTRGMNVSVVASSVDIGLETVDGNVKVSLVFDADSDGDPDIVTVWGRALLWIENRGGNLGFLPPTRLFTSVAGSICSACTMVQDANADGVFDIVFSITDSTVLLYLEVCRPRGTSRRPACVHALRACTCMCIPGVLAAPPEPVLPSVCRTLRRHGCLRFCETFAQNLVASREAGGALFSRSPRVLATLSTASKALVPADLTGDGMWDIVALHVPPFRLPSDPVASLAIYRSRLAVTASVAANGRCAGSRSFSRNFLLFACVAP
jgi:hypothetical protein